MPLSYWKIRRAYREQHESEFIISESAARHFKAQGNEGTVLEIGIFYTKLTTIDGKIIVLPNGNLANNSITNATESAIRRVDLTVGISYRAEIATAKAVLQSVMDNDFDVLKNEEAFVFVSELGDRRLESARGSSPGYTAQGLPGRRRITGFCVRHRRC